MRWSLSTTAITDRPIERSPRLGHRDGIPRERRASRAQAVAAAVPPAVRDGSEEVDEAIGVVVEGEDRSRASDLGADRVGGDLLAQECPELVDRLEWDAD